MQAPRQVPDEVQSRPGRDAFLEGRPWDRQRAAHRRRRSKCRGRQPAILISVVLGLALSAALELGMLSLSGAGL